MGGERLPPLHRVRVRDVSVGGKDGGWGGRHSIECASEMRGGGGTVKAPLPPMNDPCPLLLPMLPQVRLRQVLLEAYGRSRRRRAADGRGRRQQWGWRRCRGRGGGDR